MKKQFLYLLCSATFCFSLVNSNLLAQEIDQVADDKEEQGPDAIIEHFTQFYGEDFKSSDRFLRVINEIAPFPSENAFSAGKMQGINSWIHVGGLGVPVSNFLKYTGRVTDIEMRDTVADHVREIGRAHV